MWNFQDKSQRCALLLFLNFLIWVVFCIKREQNRISFSTLFYVDAKINKSKHFIIISIITSSAEDGTASAFLKTTFIKNDNISNIIPGF